MNIKMMNDYYKWANMNDNFFFYVHPHPHPKKIQEPDYNTGKKLKIPKKTEPALVKHSLIKKQLTSYVMNNFGGGPFIKWKAGLI